MPAVGACIDTDLDSVVDRIRTALGRDACLETPDAIEPYLSDFRGLFRGMTRLVVLPRSTNEVAK